MIEYLALASIVLYLLVENHHLREDNKWLENKVEYWHERALAYLHSTDEKDDDDEDPAESWKKP